MGEKRQISQVEEFRITYIDTTLKEEKHNHSEGAAHLLSILLLSPSVNFLHSELETAEISYLIISSEHISF